MHTSDNTPTEIIPTPPVFENEQIPLPAETTTGVNPDSSSTVVKKRQWVFTKNTGKIIFAGVLALALSLVPAFSLTSAAFLLTATNRWVLETNWDIVNQISLEIWASGFLSAYTLGGTNLRVTPLLLTLATLMMLIFFTRNVTAKNWWEAALTPLTFAVSGSALAGLGLTYAHINTTISGIWLIAAVAWILSWRSYCTEAELHPYLQTLNNSWKTVKTWAYALTLTALGGLGVANYLAWQRILDIHQLLNASSGDTIVIVIAQLLFLPNFLLGILSYYSGAGVYAATDTLITPGKAMVTPIPAVPELGIIPHTPLGWWVLLIPISMALTVGILTALKKPLQTWKEFFINWGLSTVLFAGGVALFSWISQLHYGAGRLALIGPNWSWLTLLITVQISGGYFAGYGGYRLLAEFSRGRNTAEENTVAESAELEITVQELPDLDSVIAAQNAEETVETAESDTELK